MLHCFLLFHVSFLAKMNGFFLYSEHTIVDMYRIEMVRLCHCRNADVIEESFLKYSQNALGINDLRRPLL